MLLIAQCKPKLAEVVKKPALEITVTHLTMNHERRFRKLKRFLWPATQLGEITQVAEHQPFIATVFRAPRELEGLGPQMPRFIEVPGLHGDQCQVAEGQIGIARISDRAVHLERSAVVGSGHVVSTLIEVDVPEVEENPRL